MHFVGRISVQKAAVSDNKYSGSLDLTPILKPEISVCRENKAPSLPKTILVILFGRELLLLKLELDQAEHNYTLFCLISQLP